MKKLSKIKLQEATILSDKEMKMVLGGAEGSGFVCHCNEDENNVSGIITWTADYINEWDMIADIRSRCGYFKGGDCVPTE
ncbi:TIGR04149 family rSAM-modified RiPP [Bacteroides sp.]|uniref:TIGR04149 family rSAM-modified RiPP n=1 Tax=Bacteroides sp. TaxID=29523 RepID=UPI0025BA4B19|nr:TIGR04149 family rSAM-modified RiPP [Bacteroides sp.]